MNQTNPKSIATPYLTLYAFHLRHSLRTGPQQVEDTAKDLWETCMALGQPDKFNVSRLRDELRAKLQCYYQAQYHPDREGESLSGFWELLPDERILEFTTGHPATSLLLQGKVYPMRIHETYMLDLTLHYDDPLSIEQLRLLNPHGLLLPAQINASLGQTLQLFVKPLTPPTKELAEACVNALFADSATPPPPLLHQGRLFGSPLFEFDTPAILTGTVNPQAHCHLLIWFNDHPDTEQRALNDTYYDTLHLWCSRSKILYASYQAQQHYSQALDLYSQLEAAVQRMEQLGGMTGYDETRLDTLNQLLLQMSKQLFPYVHLIRNIQDQLETINLNASNYRDKWRAIQAQCLPGDEVQFLETFANDTCPRFERQLQSYLSYLNSGLGLFDRTLATIRGLVEIDQAQIEQQRSQQEKSLQSDIQVIGIGIAAGAIVASSSGLMTLAWAWPWSPNSTGLPHPFGIAIILSAAVAIGAGWLVKLWQGRREKPAK